LFTEKFNVMKKILVSLLIVVATVTLSCSQTPTKESENSVFGPGIEFADLKHDYGVIEQGSDGTYSFEFTNTGTEPLILSNVRSSCGCTIPQWPKEPINAGETASIEVKYNTNRPGPFSKSITVYSNANEQPIVLQIKGKVEAVATAATEQ
jgi:hypothetical protein